MTNLTFARTFLRLPCTIPLQRKLFVHVTDRDFSYVYSSVDFSQATLSWKRSSKENRDRYRSYEDLQKSRAQTNTRFERAFDRVRARLRSYFNDAGNRFLAGLRREEKGVHKRGYTIEPRDNLEENAARREEMKQR